MKTKMIAPMLRESLAVFQDASVRINQVISGGVETPEADLIVPLLHDIESYISQCKKTLSAVNTADDNNSQTFQKLLSMKNEARMARMATEMKFLRSPDTESVSQAKEALKKGKSKLLSYKEALGTALDITGEDNVIELNNRAAALEKSLTKIINEIKKLPDSASSTATITNQAVKTIGGFLPDAVSTYIADTAASAGLHLPADTKIALLEVCTDLAKNCREMQLESNSVKKKLETFQKEELAQVNKLLATINQVTSETPPPKIPPRKPNAKKTLPKPFKKAPLKPLGQKKLSRRPAPLPPNIPSWSDRQQNKPANTQSKIKTSDPQPPQSSKKT